MTVSLPFLFCSFAVIVMISPHLKGSFYIIMVYDAKKEYQNQQYKDQLKCIFGRYFSLTSFTPWREATFNF